MEGVPDPFAPARLGPVTLRNRIVKAATFEGLTREHVLRGCFDMGEPHRGWRLS